MGMTLANKYLACKYLTDKEITLREFTTRVALTRCDKDGAGEGGVVVESTRGARRAAIDAEVARGDPGDLPHALFNGRALGLGGNPGEGQCCKRLNKHASGHESGVCKTCSKALDTDRPKPFWVCCPGKHGRQCKCQYLTVNAKI